MHRREKLLDAVHYEVQSPLKQTRMHGKVERQGAAQGLFTFKVRVERGG